MITDAFDAVVWAILIMLLIVGCYCFERSRIRRTRRRWRIRRGWSD